MQPIPVGETTRLLQEAQEGNSDAWSQLFTRLHERLRRIAELADVPGIDVEELIGEAWLRVWKYKENFNRERGTAQAWLKTIVNNLVLTFRAKQATRKEKRGVSAEDELEAKVYHTLEMLIDESPLYSEAIERVRIRYETKDPVAWQCFYRRYFDLLDGQSIGAECRIPVASALRKAKRVREDVQKEYEALLAQ